MMGDPGKRFLGHTKKDTLILARENGPKLILSEAEKDFLRVWLKLEKELPESCCSDESVLLTLESAAPEITDYLKRRDQ